MGEASIVNKKYLRAIYIISALIPIVVALLILNPAKLSMGGAWIKSLPSVHAAINSLTVLTLVAALWSIKTGRVSMHRAFMFVSLLLGVLFLISYILYHSNVASVKFGDIDHDGLLSEYELSQVGITRPVYLFVLLSHILCSILVVPFVLLAFYFALTDQVTKHKKIVKYTFPVWLYVSITGVVVYFLINPYYQ